LTEYRLARLAEAGERIIVSRNRLLGAAEQVWNSVPSSRGTPSNPILIDLNGFLPPIFTDGGSPQMPGRQRYRYAGSLTTPDCAQIINWNLLTQPLAATAREIDQFRGWFPAGNARPIQPLYRRFVQLG
jgi:carbonic anhydrase